mmetsp:Transcript_137366/g.238918  ORF Transcript_137366/g.238918 Transcript_137366/m.238918 type:complete len:224 (+) Transcript_137366:1847-2518(+)
MTATQQIDDNCYLWDGLRKAFCFNPCLLKGHEGYSKLKPVNVAEPNCLCGLVDHIMTLELGPTTLRMHELGEEVGGWGGYCSLGMDGGSMHLVYLRYEHYSIIRTHFCFSGLCRLESKEALKIFIRNHIHMHSTSVHILYGIHLRLCPCQLGGTQSPLHMVRRLLVFPCTATPWHLACMLGGGRSLTPLQSSATGLPALGPWTPDLCTYVCILCSPLAIKNER